MPKSVHDSYSIASLQNIAERYSKITNSPLAWNVIYTATKVQPISKQCF